MACSWDREANVARAEKLIREAAGRGANIVLIQELFETPYFCKDHDARYFDLAKPLEGHPAVEHFRCAGARARCGAAGERVRACQQRLLQFCGDRGRRRRGARQLPQIAHPRGAGLPREVLFLAGRHGIQSIRHASLRSSASRSAGISGFRRRALPWRCMGAEILMYPTAIGSEPQDPGLDSSGALAADHAGPRGGKRHAAGRLEPHRRRGGREVRNDFLRLVFHRLAYGREDRRGGPQQRDRAHRRRSISTTCAATGKPGASSAIAVPICIIRCCRSMDAPEVRALPHGPGICRSGDDRRQRGSSPDHRDRHRAVARRGGRSRNGARSSIPSAHSCLHRELHRHQQRDGRGRAALRRHRAGRARKLGPARRAPRRYSWPTTRASTIRFLRAEFRRAGSAFSAPVLCTVKLSRRLFPEHPRHNLDAVMERHGLACSARHRALGDARVISDFWIEAQPRAARADSLGGRGAAAHRRGDRLPPHLPEGLADELPEGPGRLPLFRRARRARCSCTSARADRCAPPSWLISPRRRGRRAAAPGRGAQGVRASIGWRPPASSARSCASSNGCRRLTPAVQPARQGPRAARFTLRLAEDSAAARDRCPSPSWSPRARAMLRPVSLRRRMRARRSPTSRAARELCLKMLGLEESEGSCFAHQSAVQGRLHRQGAAACCTPCACGWRSRR